MSKRIVTAKKVRVAPDRYDPIDAHPKCTTDPVTVGDIVVVCRRKKDPIQSPEFSTCIELLYDFYTGVVVKTWSKGQFYLKSVDCDFDNDRSWTRYGNGIYIDPRRPDMYEEITVVDQAEKISYVSQTLRTVTTRQKMFSCNTFSYETEEDATVLKINSPTYFSKPMTYVIHHEYGDSAEGTDKDALTKAMRRARIKYLQSLV